MACNRNPFVPAAACAAVITPARAVRALPRGALFAGAVLAAAIATSAHVAADEPSGADQQALEWFEQSDAAYKEGSFQKAVDLLLQAYKVKPEPVLLYNLARAYEGLGNLEEAVAAYARYLEAETRIPDRGAIEQKIATLRSQIREREELRKQKATAAPKPVVAPAPMPPPSSPRVVPWIVAGLGGAVLAGGAVVGSMASRRHDAAVAADSQRAANDKQSEARSLATVANTLFVAGGALAVGGVLWGLLIPRQTAPSAAQAPTPRGVHLQLGWGWLGLEGAVP